MRLEEVLPVKAVAGHPAPLEASQSELKAWSSLPHIHGEGTGPGGRLSHLNRPQLVGGGGSSGVFADPPARSLECPTDRRLPDSHLVIHGRPFCSYSRAPRGLSPQRTAIKESLGQGIHVQVTADQIQEMDKMVAALCSAVWVPQLAQGRAGQTCWRGARHPQLPCHFPRALHTQAPAPAGPAGGIGWSNHLADPLSQPQRHPCLWVCSFGGSCLPRGCPGGDTSPGGHRSPWLPEASGDGWCPEVLKPQGTWPCLHSVGRSMRTEQSRAGILLSLVPVAVAAPPWDLTHCRLRRGGGDAVGLPGCPQDGGHSTGLALSTQAIVTCPQALLLRPCWAGPRGACRVFRTPPPGLSSLGPLTVGHVPPGTRADLGITHVGRMSLLCVS